MGPYNRMAPKPSPFTPPWFELVLKQTIPERVNRIKSNIRKNVRRTHMCRYMTCGLYESDRAVLNGIIIIEPDGRWRYGTDVTDLKIWTDIAPSAEINDYSLELYVVGTYGLQVSGTTDVDLSAVCTTTCNTINFAAFSFFSFERYTASNCGENRYSL